MIDLLIIYCWFAISYISIESINIYYFSLYFNIQIARVLSVRTSNERIIINPNNINDTFRLCFIYLSYYF